MKRMILESDCCKCKFDEMRLAEEQIDRVRKTYGSTIYQKTGDISLVKEALGHADERTTYKHYIFSTDNREERQRKILDALQGNTISGKNSDDNVRQREKNIIQFPTNKKRKTLRN